jgi:hypothetical protein
MPDVTAKLLSKFSLSEDNDNSSEKSVPTKTTKSKEVKEEKDTKVSTKICENSKCAATSTPLWRKGWVTSSGLRVRLCNACGLHYRKGHYCKYCKEIYRDVFELEEVEPWVSCERCKSNLLVIFFYILLKVNGGRTLIVQRKMFLSNHIIYAQIASNSAPSFSKHNNKS